MSVGQLSNCVGEHLHVNNDKLKQQREIFIRLFFTHSVYVARCCMLKWSDDRLKNHTTS